MEIIAYVGDLQDKNFSWDGGNWNGNIPKRQSPEIWFGHDVWRYVVKAIKDEKLVGKQTDWGSHVARASKKDVEELLDTIEEKNEDILEHFSSNPYDDIREYLKTLSEDEEYALVVAEI